MNDVELERASEHAEMAMALLQGNAIPPTPKFFELMFVYATGRIARLNAEIDAALREGQLTADLAASLSETYLARDIDSRVRSMSRAMTETIAEVNLAIDEAITSTSTFSDSLQLAGEQIAGGIGEAELQALAATLLSETRRIQSTNQELESQLSQSRVDLIALQSDLEMTRRESLTDALTGIANRKAFNQQINSGVEAAHGVGGTLVLVLFDIDHFKAFNDSWGHLVGDQVLRLFAQMMRSHCRAGDFAARFGGEEFALIMHGATLEHGIPAAEAIKNAIQAKELLRRSTNEKLGRITVSAGIAELQPGETPLALIARADRALYRAKHAGRNRIARAGLTPDDAVVA